MELSTAVGRLSALAQTARLQVFRLLVRTGTEGMPAGEIATELELPPQTLSFHLKHLSNAGLIESRREGRSLIYSLQVDGMRELLAFLSEDCCQGRRELCVPLGKSAKARSAAISPKPERLTVLFLCSKNSARSQMAEALLKKHAGDQFLVHSAGLRPAAVAPLTLKVLNEIGIDTSACTAKDFGDFLGRVPIHFGIVVCDRADRECTQIFPFAVKRLYWPFEDPAAFEGSRAARLAKFREVRDAIDARVREWLDEVEQARELAG
tara:strand:+ start:63192 stop:63986 length:795 start_codon:yes stop_codon:yes gene_type:complete